MDTNMDTNTDTNTNMERIMKVITENQHPVSIRTIGLKTKIGRKFVRPVIRRQLKDKQICRVDPSLVGSNKKYLNLFTYPNNTYYFT